MTEPIDRADPLPPSPPPTVRPAEAADTPYILALWRELMDFHAQRDPWLTRGGASAEEAFREWLDWHRLSDEGLVLVADAEQQLVGYLLGAIALRPPAFAVRRHGYVFDLCVAPTARRLGVGSHLVTEAEAWFRARGVPRLELSVAVANPVSQAFWKARGYTPSMVLLSRAL